MQSGWASRPKSRCCIRIWGPSCAARHRAPRLPSSPPARSGESCWAFTATSSTPCSMAHCPPSCCCCGLMPSPSTRSMPGCSPLMHRPPRRLLTRHLLTNLSTLAHRCWPTGCARISSPSGAGRRSRGTCATACTMRTCRSIPSRLIAMAAMCTCRNTRRQPLSARKIRPSAVARLTRRCVR